MQQISFSYLTEWVIHSGILPQSKLEVESSSGHNKFGSTAPPMYCIGPFVDLFLIYPAKKKGRINR